MLNNSESSCLSGHGGVMESVYSTTTERLKILCIPTSTTEQPQFNSRATLAKGLHKTGFSDVPQHNSSTPDKLLHKSVSQFNSCTGLVQWNMKQIPLKPARPAFGFSNPHLETCFSTVRFLQLPHRGKAGRKQHRQHWTNIPQIGINK